MSEVERLLDQLQRAYDGDAWCGSSMRETLKGVTVERAARRPLPDAHSIWEIVLHVSAWLNAVRELLEGNYVLEPAEGDWQVVTDTSADAWATALDKLQRNHDDLRQVIERLSDADLDERIGTERDRTAGTGVTRYVTLHGTAQHYLYHAAQIALLKK